MIKKDKKPMGTSGYLDSGPPLNEDKRISAMLWSQVPCSGVKGRY